MRGSFSNSPARASHFHTLDALRAATVLALEHFHPMKWSRQKSALLGFAATLVAADPTVGTWKLNTAKSKYSPGPAPKSATITYEETADGIKRMGESVDADGNKTSFEYTAFE